jgi:hypothetical protein
MAVTKSFDMAIAGELNLDLILYGLPAEIGAGDSFDAGFLHAYLLTKDLVTYARARNITGALSTQALGGTEAFRDVELRNSFLAEHKFFELLAH